MSHGSASKRQSCSRLRPVPETLQSPCNVDAENDCRDRRYHQLKCSDGNSGELRLERIPNFHCKSLPTRRSKTNAVDVAAAGKRGSMYQSSSEISRIRKLQEGRRKIDSACDADEFFSFDIVDSSSKPSTSGDYLSSHQNGWSEAKPSSETRKVHRASKDFLDLSFRELPDMNFKLDRPRLDCALLKNDAGGGFLEISLEDEITKGPCRNSAPHLLDRESDKYIEANSSQKINVCHIESNCGERERDLVTIFPKSMSTKVSTSDVTHPSESVHGIRNSVKSRSSSFKKFLDPIMKSKSLRSPTLLEKEGSDSITVPVSRKDCVSRKSLLSDFSRTERSQDTNCHQNGENRVMATTLSPAHLRAVLKFESRNGIPVFEFCVEGPQESITARSWQTGSELDWIYTFHSCGKRSSAAGRVSKDDRRCSPPTVGQMQVSSYLCSEVGKDGSLNNSVTTEFVLYDIAHARQSFAVDEKSRCTETTQSPMCSTVDKSIYGGSPQQINLIDQQSISRNNSEVSTSCPWSEEDLYSHMEIAATIIQIPFNKDKSREMKNGLSPGTIKVVIPSGLHGLPSDNEASPSSLLDRWRYGGDCDCGGWDMACPIVVLGNTYVNNWVDSITKEGKHPMELFVQGSKEELPALSMRSNGEGQLLVDFHARLSALQAFSVSISLLHCSEASTAVSIEKGKHKLYSGSLKMLLEEEVRQFVEAVTAEERKKKPKTKRGKAPPCVALDPPFSPLGRV